MAMLLRIGYEPILASCEQCASIAALPTEGVDGIALTGLEISFAASVVGREVVEVEFVRVEYLEYRYGISRH